MAQFDYYRQRGAPGYWLNCQTDYLSDLSTCFVVPLIPCDFSPRAFHRLNPISDIEGDRYFMLTQQAGPIPVMELKQPLGSLAQYRHEITNALDFLITGV
jgi:toxin CcdB